MVTDGFKITRKKTFLVLFEDTFKSVLMIVPDWQNWKDSWEAPMATETGLMMTTASFRASSCYLWLPVMIASYKSVSRAGGGGQLLKEDKECQALK